MTWHISSVNLTNALKILCKFILLTQTITSASTTASSEKIDAMGTSIAVFSRNVCSNFFHYVQLMGASIAFSNYSFSSKGLCRVNHVPQSHHC